MIRKVMWPVLLVLAGCGAGQQAGSSSSSLAARDTFAGDDIKAMDKARGVQETLNQDKERTDAAIEGAASSSAAE